MQPSSAETAETAKAPEVPPQVAQRLDKSLSWSSIVKSLLAGGIAGGV